MLWIEALEDKVEFCKQKYNNLQIENAIVSDKIEFVNFNRSNNGQSSSILDLGLHKDYHPHVWYINSYNVETKLLKDIINKYDINYRNYSFLNSKYYPYINFRLYLI